MSQPEPARTGELIPRDEYLAKAKASHAEQVFTSVTEYMLEHVEDAVSHAHACELLAGDRLAGRKLAAEFLRIAKSPDFSERYREIITLLGAFQADKAQQCINRMESEGLESPALLKVLDLKAKHYMRMAALFDPERYAPSFTLGVQPAKREPMKMSLEEINRKIGEMLLSHQGADE
jgi:hypothetical protein